MLAKIQSAVVIGIDAHIIEIEIDAQKGLPGTIVLGLPDSAVKESKDRAKSALKNSQFGVPSLKTTINLAPADIKKEGPYFDLPIAIGLLAATEQISTKKIENFLFIGELSLDGGIRPVRGVLAIACTCRKLGLHNIILPEHNAQEASVIKELNIFPARSLIQVCNFLNGIEEIKACTSAFELYKEYPSWDTDFNEIKGQARVKQAVEIAVAGGHNMLMIGPPGSGKTMIAQRIPTILPHLHFDEAIETTKIHSMAGTLSTEKGIITHPPFRAPHHTISTIGLAGGGSYPQPGEISLSHNGVLFLDELPEFQRATLEVLRQPLENGIVHISRAQRCLIFPARFMLICAMNPCPCGYLTDPRRQCQCSTMAIRKYLAKISGPLLDRIDLHIEVPPLKTCELDTPGPLDSSSLMKERILRARAYQKTRYAHEHITLNAQLKSRHIKKYCILDTDAKQLLIRCADQMQLSARAYDKLIKIGRTIADMEESEIITEQHIAQAVQYRSLDTVYKNI